MDRQAAAALIYLWTRDSFMEVNEQTRLYVRQHLEANAMFAVKGFSDVDRAEMAYSLVDEFFPELKGA